MTELMQVMEELKGIKGYMDGRVAEVGKLHDEEQKKVLKRFEDLQGQVVALQKELLNRTSKEGKIRLQAGRFAGLDMLDLRIVEELVNAKFRGTDSKPAIMGDVIEARKQLSQSITERSLIDWQERAADHRSVPGMNRLSAGIQNFEFGSRSWMRELINAKAMDAVTSGSGSQLVPTFEAAELWMDVNLQTLVLPLFPQQPMPTNPFDIPGQLGNTNWYPGTENVQALTTDLNTPKTTLTAYELKTGVPFSDALEEDSIVALVPAIREGLARNAAQVLDDVLLNAENTNSTTNISWTNTTISPIFPGKAQYLLGWAGLRALPLVSNSAGASIDKSAAADVAMFTAILGKLGKYGAGRVRGEVNWITDPRTMAALFGIASLLTIQNFGDKATLSAGELRDLFAIPVIRSDQMVVSSVTGKISSTATLNTTGNVLLVNTSQWRVGFRRQITMEAFREPGKGQTTMYVSMRIAFNERTGTKTTATHTGLIYDITGV